VLADRLTTTDPDVLRELLSTFIHTLMGAEANALCGAGYGERSNERTNQRNGYRHRQFDTRTGSLDLAIPKLRQGSYFPDWLLERRKRAERALTTVVATCYLLGVSTRRMDKLVETLGITSLSKSQVSVMAKELDTTVEAFRARPLDAGPVHVRRCRRPGAQGPRSGPRRECARPDRGRGQRRGLPGDPGH
jgi:putative transposase